MLFSRARVEALEARHLLAGNILRPDHVVVVIEEDRATNAIGDLVDMPYFNQLASSGLRYGNSQGIGRPSRLNYMALFSGDTQGVTDNYQPFPLFTTPNLAKSLNTTGQSFIGYSETLPADGSLVTYAVDPNDPDKHPDGYFKGYNPMAHFSDYGPGKTNADVNKTFNAFPSDFTALPTVSFVIPNMFHNTHGSNEAPYTDASSDYDRLRINADLWLKQKFDGYLQWAKTHNSLLIITGDESDEKHPGNVTTIVNGDPRLFVSGVNTSPIVHYNTLRTLEDMFSLTALGNSAAASAFATNAAGQLIPDQTDTRAGSATSVISSANPTVPGQAVTFTATVSSVAGIPSGTAQFIIDGANFGSPIALVNGVAAVGPISLLAGGAHAVKVLYSGDAAFQPSASSTLTQTVQVSNDNFANRLPISGVSAAVTGSNVGATKESGEPNHAGNAGGKSVWWSWTAPFAGNVTIDTSGSNFDTLLAAYTGSSVSSLTTKASNDNDPAGGTTTSKIKFTTVAGSTYQIAVDGRNGAAGNITLNLSFILNAPSAPTNVVATNGTYPGRVAVTWNASTGATAYNVYRNTRNSTSGAVNISGDIAGLNFDDTTGVVNKTYYYWVRAKNAGGTSGFSSSNSGWSSPVPLAAKASTIASMPADLFSSRPISVARDLFDLTAL